MRHALLNPLGLSLLIASVVLVGLMLSVLDRWREQAPWVALLGILAYIAAAAVIYRWPTGEVVLDETETVDSTVPEGENAEDGDGKLSSRLVAEALRHLNDVPFLSQCNLAHQLPNTLGHRPTLERGQALREVLVAAIERLKPLNESSGSVSPKMLHYYILHDAYVQGRPVAYITTRHGIAEATYFRSRLAAVSGVASDLQSQEELNGGGSVRLWWTMIKNWFGDLRWPHLFKQQ